MYQLCHNLQCETGYFAPCAWEVYNFCIFDPKNYLKFVIFVILKFSKLFCQKKLVKLAVIVLRKIVLKNLLGQFVLLVQRHWCCTMETNVDISYNGTN